MAERANPAQTERQKSIEKGLDGALLLTFFAYINPDRDLAQESIDVANTVFDACGYPRVPNVR